MHAARRAVNILHDGDEDDDDDYDTLLEPENRPPARGKQDRVIIIITITIIIIHVAVFVVVVSLYRVSRRNIPIAIYPETRNINEFSFLFYVTQQDEDDKCFCFSYIFMFWSKIKKRTSYLIIFEKFKDSRLTKFISLKMYKYVLCFYFH